MIPFGPNNGPATFVNFIYDIYSVWKKFTKSIGTPASDTTYTRIIIDDIISWSSTEDYALTYIQCQIKVCQAYYCLSLNLQKSHFFPKRFKFIGIDVCVDGNRPAQSKYGLLETWPAPELVCNVAKFIGFAQFYSRFIHHFELHIAPLCKLTKHEYTDPVAPLWMEAAQNAFGDMKLAIISNPCLQQFDHRKLVVLCMDFLSLGFGYVLLQPGNNAASTQALLDYRAGKGFSFMNKESAAHLHLVCFGAHKCQGNEVRLLTATATCSHC